jgi:hypothetical protein
MEAAQVKNACVLPEFMFSDIGRMTMSLYSVRRT